MSQNDTLVELGNIAAAAKALADVYMARGYEVGGEHQKWQALLTALGYADPPLGGNPKTCPCDDLKAAQDRLKAYPLAAKGQGYHDV